MTWLIFRDFRSCLNITRKSIKRSNKRTQSTQRDMEKKALARDRCNRLYLQAIFLPFLFKMRHAEGRKQRQKQRNPIEEERVSLEFCCCRSPRRTNIQNLRERTAEPRIWFLSLFSCASLFHVFSLHSTLKDIKTFHTWVAHGNRK